MLMVIEQLTAEKAQELNWDYSKNTTYEVATAFWFNRNQDRKNLAVDAGIQNYTGQAFENIKIKNMLLNKLEELKTQVTKDVINKTQTDVADFKIEAEKTVIYNKIINALTIKEGKISLTNKDNITISRNDGNIQRSTDITDMPLVVDGQGILIKYTNPDTWLITKLAIDDFENNTFVFRDITENANSKTIYSAPIGKANVNIAQVDVIDKGSLHLEPRPITQIPNPIPEFIMPWTQNPPLAGIEKNPVSEPGKNELDTGNSSIETKKEQPLVLTEDLLENFDSVKKYPGDLQWRTYAEVYQERYDALKGNWEGKTINAVLVEEEEPTIGTIDFVGWTFDIVLPNGDRISIPDVYELSADRVIFYREWGQKYALIKDKIQDSGFLAHVETYIDNTVPPQNIASNEENQNTRWKDLLTKRDQEMEIK